jgi:DNA-binding SARP family transcriptional activator
VLTYLALRRNELVASERILTDIWTDAAVPESSNALQAVVSRIRKTLPAGRLLTRSGGYVLTLSADELDAAAFEKAFDEGQATLSAGEAAEAASILRGALDLWRGPALIDFRYDSFAQAEIARLEEMHLTCLEAAVDADLATGAEESLVAELKTLVFDNPLRERLRRQLMLALYRSGRQAEALDVFADTRDTLKRELGIPPSAALVSLHAAILRHEAHLGRVPAQARPPRPRLPRRLVTILTIDTAMTSPDGGPLDPEAVYILKGQLRELFVPIITRNGGRLLASWTQPYQAVFGAESGLTDDARRATLAAIEIRNSLLEKEAEWTAVRGPRLISRLGVATADGLVDGSDGLEVMTAALPIAQQLMLQAEAGQVLVSGPTRELIGGALDVIHRADGTFLALSPPSPAESGSLSTAVSDSEVAAADNEFAGDG